MMKKIFGISLIVSIIIGWYIYHKQQQLMIKNDDENILLESVIDDARGDVGHFVKYVNNRYKYQIVFSEEWYINNDSSEKNVKVLEDNLVFGGQTFWSNYSKY